MSSDNPQHQMEFILAQQAAFSSDMIELKDRLNKQSDNIDKLAAIVLQLAETVETHRGETQEAIDGLILANEATRDLANKTASLAINVSHRLTAHEKEPHG